MAFGAKYRTNIHLKSMRVCLKQTETISVITNRLDWTALSIRYQYVTLNKCRFIFLYRKTTQFHPVRWLVFNAILKSYELTYHLTWKKSVPSVFFHDNSILNAEYFIEDRGETVIFQMLKNIHIGYIKSKKCLYSRTNKWRVPKLESPIMERH